MRIVAYMPLSTSRITIGSRYCTAVASSGELMTKSPSPVKQTTIRSGWTSCAATAAGRPYPIEPERGQACAQEGHDLAEVDVALHRLVPKIRFVVGSSRDRPLAPTRVDRW